MATLATEIHWVEINPAEVLRLAVETGLTTYDASYLHVAKVMDLPLVTFDERLAKATASRR
jgi:predicted nucleic acid-binding protein